MDFKSLLKEAREAKRAAGRGGAVPVAGLSAERTYNILMSRILKKEAAGEKKSLLLWDLRPQKEVEELKIRCFENVNCESRAMALMNLEKSRLMSVSKEGEVYLEADKISVLVFGDEGNTEVLAFLKSLTFVKKVFTLEGGLEKFYADFPFCFFRNGAAEKNTSVELEKIQKVKNLEFGFPLLAKKNVFVGNIVQGAMMKKLKKIMNLEYMFDFSENGLGGEGLDMDYIHLAAPKQLNEEFFFSFCDKFEKYFAEESRGVLVDTSGEDVGFSCLCAALIKFKSLDFKVAISETLKFSSQVYSPSHSSWKALENFQNLVRWQREQLKIAEARREEEEVPFTIPPSFVMVSRINFDLEARHVEEIERRNPLLSDIIEDNFSDSALEEIKQQFKELSAQINEKTEFLLPSDFVRMSRDAALVAAALHDSSPLLSLKLRKDQGFIRDFMKVSEFFFRVQPSEFEEGKIKVPLSASDGLPENVADCVRSLVIDWGIAEEMGKEGGKDEARPETETERGGA